MERQQEYQRRPGPVQASSWVCPHIHNPLLWADLHIQSALWHIVNIIKFHFNNFVKVHLHAAVWSQQSTEGVPASQPPSNAGAIFTTTQRGQFCPGLQHGCDFTSREALWLLQLCFRSTHTCKINHRPRMVRRLQRCCPPLCVCILLNGA